jgi:hypothetical protein
LRQRSFFETILKCRFFLKLLHITILMGIKSLHKRKFYRTRDKTHHNEQMKEHYWKKKREHENIEERNNDDVNRDFQQEEVQPGTHVHIVYIKSV